MPATRSLSNLPIPPTPLIGRDRELATLRERLLDATVRLLTLTGPGGSGKTRLALQAAAELEGALERGAAFVELAPIRDPALVPHTIAQALGVQEGGERGPLEALEAALREQHLLLVLDNFEQVLEAAPSVAHLLAACPGLTILVTSRAPLHLRGEHEHPVPPLDLPDPQLPATPETLAASAAVTLLAQRAGDIRPGFRVTEANAADVAEIVRRLDGLPLAIELAAARLKLLSPAALLERLGERLRLLTGGARDAPARQRTLRDTIAWSHDLLEPSEQALFRRLGVFLGGWDLEAAEVVCGADGDLGLEVLDGLASLADKSLVRRQETPEGELRFGMLETLREYALERLEESGEGEAVGAAHAEHFLALAEREHAAVWGPRFFGPTGTPRQRAWFARLEGEHDNLRAALRRADEQGAGEYGRRLGGALALFWFMHGHFAEGQRWLDTFLGRDAEGSPEARARALSGAGLIAWGRGDYGRGKALYEECIAVCRARDDSWNLALQLHFLGVLVAYQGDRATSRRLMEEGLALYRELGDAWAIGFTLYDYGKVVKYQGDHDEARALIEEGLRLMWDAGDRWQSAEALVDLAGLAQERGDVEQVAELASRSLALYREMGSRWYLPENLELLAGVAGARGNPLRSARLLGAAEAVREAAGTAQAPADHAALATRVEATRARLDAGTFAAAWAEGRALGAEQAIAYALAAEEVVPAGAEAIEDAAPRTQPDYPVFISYASRDVAVAEQVCASLEAQGIACWMAPRDILPGQDYGEALIDAINASEVLLLVLSARSNTSPQVRREVERAASKDIPILPLRIEDVSLSKGMEYFISAGHWLDATQGPLEPHLDALAQAVKRLLVRAAGAGG